MELSKTGDCRPLKKNALTREKKSASLTARRAAKNAGISSLGALHSTTMTTTAHWRERPTESCLVAWSCSGVAAESLHADAQRQPRGPRVSGRIEHTVPLNTFGWRQAQGARASCPAHRRSRASMLRAPSRASQTSRESRRPFGSSEARAVCRRGPWRSAPERPTPGERVHARPSEA